VRAGRQTLDAQSFNAFLFLSFLEIISAHCVTYFHDTSGVSGLHNAAHCADVYMPAYSPRSLIVGRRGQRCCVVPATRLNRGGAKNDATLHGKAVQHTTALPATTRTPLRTVALDAQLGKAFVPLLAPPSGNPRHDTSPTYIV
jgi:hypothetical protein